LTADRQKGKNDSNNHEGVVTDAHRSDLLFPVGKFSGRPPYLFIFPGPGFRPGDGTCGEAAREVIRE
jgi:hypothetical protein